MYQCECGRQYNNPQSYNGHKSHCIIHMQCNGKYDTFLEDDYNRHETLRKTVRDQVKERQMIKSQQQQEELERWISEQHTCEKCGKVMTEKYGSGRFCSIKLIVRIHILFLMIYVIEFLIQLNSMRRLLHQSCSNRKLKIIILILLFVLFVTHSYHTNLKIGKHVVRIV